MIDPNSLPPIRQITSNKIERFIAKAICGNINSWFIQLKALDKLVSFALYLAVIYKSSIFQS